MKLLKYYIRFTIVFLLGFHKESFADGESEQNPCTLLKSLAGSIGKCLTSSGVENVNIDSPKDVYNYLTDSNQRACLVKCTMREQGFINKAGKLDTSGFLNNQNALPQDMKEKLSLSSLNSCLEIAVDFNPEKCSTYQEFSNCILRKIVDAFTPSALDCFTKVPGVGRVFAVLQSSLDSTNTKDDENDSSSNSGFLSTIREKISHGTDNISNWFKSQKDKIEKLF